MTPTAPSLALLRQQWHIAAPVARWPAQGTVRVDTWGFGDIVVAHPSARLVLMVEATRADHAPYRSKKARARPDLAAWLRAGGAFEIRGWVR